MLPMEILLIHRNSGDRIPLEDEEEQLTEEDLAKDTRLPREIRRMDSQESGLNQEFQNMLIRRSNSQDNLIEMAPNLKFTDLATISQV